MLFRSKAELIEAATQQLRSQRMIYAMPLVVRLLRYVSIPRMKRLACSRRSVIVRDQETCQYCGAQPGRAELTIDHIIPRAQGGKTSWDNVVAACAACNHRKANRTPESAGMRLMRKPHEPRYATFALVGVLERHAVWQKYAYG